MYEITEKSTLREIRKIPEFAEFAPFIMFNNQAPGEDPINPTLDPEDFTLQSSNVSAAVEGLNALRSHVQNGVPVAHDIWNEEEKKASPDRENTKLLFMPGKPGAPFMLVIAGGAYATVCSFVEGFPTAARLNQLGYNAFVLSYRVHQKPLMPKPQEDVAAALRYIFTHAQELSVATENYAVVGFSAGGHLTASWGTEKLGFRRFSLPKPAALILAYGASTVELPKEGEPVGFFLSMMVGDQPDPEMMRAVNISDNVDSDYPPTFLWQCKDDPLVPFSGAVRMDEALTLAGVPHQFKQVEKGGHGIGIADNTEAAGWLNEAVAFWQAQSN